MEEQKKKVRLYPLTTCPSCKSMKKFLTNTTYNMNLSRLICLTVVSNGLHQKKSRDIILQ